MTRVGSQRLSEKRAKVLRKFRKRLGVSSEEMDQAGDAIRQWLEEGRRDQVVKPDQGGKK